MRAVRAGVSAVRCRGPLRAAPAAGNSAWELHLSLPGTQNPQSRLSVDHGDRPSRQRATHPQRTARPQQTCLRGECAACPSRPGRTAHRSCAPDALGTPAGAATQRSVSRPCSDHAWGGPASRGWAPCRQHEQPHCGGVERPAEAPPGRCGAAAEPCCEAPHAGCTLCACSRRPWLEACSGRWCWGVMRRSACPRWQPTDAWPCEVGSSCMWAAGQVDLGGILGVLLGTVWGFC